MVDKAIDNKGVYHQILPVAKSMRIEAQCLLSMHFAPSQGWFAGGSRDEEDRTSW